MKNNYGEKPDSVGFGEAISVCFKKYFVFEGRATQSEYWYFLLFCIILYIPAVFLSSFGSVSGTLILDDGACDAITNQGKSLLPVGIIEVQGEFNKGDLIKCSDSDGKEVARGLTNFNNHDINSIKGLNSDEIRTFKDFFSEEEVVHRNNLVLD